MLQILIMNIDFGSIVHIFIYTMDYKIEGELFFNKVLKKLMDYKNEGEH